MFRNWFDGSVFRDLNDGNKGCLVFRDLQRVTAIVSNKPFDPSVDLALFPTVIAFQAFQMFPSPLPSCPRRVNSSFE